MAFYFHQSLIKWPVVHGVTLPSPCDSLKSLQQHSELKKKCIKIFLLGVNVLLEEGLKGSRPFLVPFQSDPHLNPLFVVSTLKAQSSHISVSMFCHGIMVLVHLGRSSFSQKGLKAASPASAFAFLFPSSLQRFAVLSCVRHSLSCHVHVKNSRLAGLVDNLKWNYSVCACVTEKARVRVHACVCVCARVSAEDSKCFSQAEIIITDSMHQGSFPPD